jgi:hypothetical protein
MPAVDPEVTRTSVNPLAGFSAAGAGVVRPGAQHVAGKVLAAAAEESAEEPDMRA